MLSISEQLLLSSWAGIPLITQSSFNKINKNRELKKNNNIRYNYTLVILYAAKFNPRREKKYLSDFSIAFVAFWKRF
jgi:hypothetical protein